MNELIYQTKKIPYQIKRANIKNLYIHIKQGEVIVKAPNYLKQQQIEEFVKRKAKWINEKLEENKGKIKEEEIKPEEKQRLIQIVESSIHKYAKILGVMPKKVRIRNLNYAWGSCSSNQNISINEKLAKKQEKTIEYVVLHEMCHLIYMNHSKKFWDLLEKNMPDYKEYKKWLA